MQQAAWWDTMDLIARTDTFYNQTKICWKKTYKKWVATDTNSRQKKKSSTAIKQLTEMLLKKNQDIQDYLGSLAASEVTDYFLWKATKDEKTAAIQFSQERSK